MPTIELASNQNPAELLFFTLTTVCDLMRIQQQGEVVMNESIKKTSMRTISFIALTAFICGCASTTVIRSRPEGAIAYLDNIRLGPTPQKYSDTAILGTTKQLRLEKEGFMPLNTVIRKDQFAIGPCIGGIFVLVPFLWVEGYPDAYEFTLEPAPAK